MFHTKSVALCRLVLEVLSFDHFRKFVDSWLVVPQIWSVVMNSVLNQLKRISMAVTVAVADGNVKAILVMLGREQFLIFLFCCVSL